MARTSYRRQYPRLYKRYPAHDLGESQAQLSPKEWRAAAELAGFSPGEAKQMVQIVRGESGYKPGILGHDPGGTTGIGGTQTTPGVWGQAGIDYMNKLGGERALRNPIKNMKMAKFLYDSAGKSFSPWYGTRFLNRDLDRSKVHSVLGGSGLGRTSSRTGTTTIPGVDNSALRQQLLQGYLTQRGQPGALLGLASGLAGAQDTPSMQIPGERLASGGRGTRDVIAGNGVPVMKMLRTAVAWDKNKQPYLLGGGHGSIAKPGTPVDCSGYWSAITGVKVPMVSGQFATWGKPGEGKHVTIYANDGHVLGKIKDPRTGKWRWFATSRSNPGGGAGEIAPPSASYLSSFTVRHP